MINIKNIVRHVLHVLNKLKLGGISMRKVVPPQIAQKSTMMLSDAVLAKLCTHFSTHRLAAAESAAASLPAVRLSQTRSRMTNRMTHLHQLPKIQLDHKHHGIQTKHVIFLAHFNAVAPPHIRIQPHVVAQQYCGAEPVDPIDRAPSSHQRLLYMMHHRGRWNAVSCIREQM